MVSSPKAFEQLIHRIHELLEGSGADVVWNDRIVDPDNPAQQRQIDVTIKRDGNLTLVECRLHRTRQDVKWIEEMIGRRMSLGADSVIAVSSSGFTKGAMSKAKRFGVILRDLRELTEAEILSWGRSVALTVYFYQYLDLRLSLVFEKSSIPQLEEERLKAELRSYPGKQSLFNAAAEQLDTLNLLIHENRGHVGRFYLRLQLEEFHLCGEPVIEVDFAGRAKLLSRDVACPAVLAYGAPELARGQRDVVVEKFSLGESSIGHSRSRVTVLLDISNLEMPPFCQFRYARLSAKEEMDMELFELVGVERLAATGGNMAVSIVAVN